MAKTLAEIQQMITAKYDQREIINELADFLETFSLGGGMVLESYQNSAMGVAVMAYVFKDEDDNIFRVYEPLRNNDVSRKTYSYADSIDKFQFDNANWFSNKCADLKLVDIPNSADFSDNYLTNIVIDGNSNDGIVIKGNILRGNFGSGCPNSAEIYIVGNNVSIRYSSSLSADFNNNLAFYIDSLDTDSVFESISMLGNNYFDFNSNKGIFRRTSFGQNCGASCDTSDAQILDSTIGDDCYLNLSGYINDCQLDFAASCNVVNEIANCYFGMLAATDSSNGQISNSTFGDRVSYTPPGAINFKHYVFLASAVYELGVSGGNVTATAV